MTYDGKYFKQTADIDWPANTTWTSGIGTDADHRFGGHYDGGGNAIRHLTINGTSKYTALFGYVCGADNHQGGSVLTTLKNIVLEDCNIDASSVSGSYASGICAFIKSISYTRIDNCRVSGTISGASYASGIICNNSSSTYVTNCFADVTVNATHKGKIFASIGTTYGDDKVVGNYYHDNGDGVGVGYSNNLTASQVAPLYTVSGTNFTAAATNATVTHAGTHYFASGATVTLTTDGSHIISGTPTVSGAGASLGSVASDKKSMTLTVGTADVTATWYDLALFGYDDDPLVDGSTNHPYVISTTVLPKTHRLFPTNRQVSDKRHRVLGQKVKNFTCAACQQIHSCARMREEARMFFRCTQRRKKTRSPGQILFYQWLIPCE